MQTAADVLKEIKALGGTEEDAAWLADVNESDLDVDASASDDDEPAVCSQRRKEMKFDLRCC